MHKLMFSFGLLSIVGVAGSAAASPRNPVAIAKLEAKAAQQAAKKAFDPIVAELHAIKVLLERADHDYKGHRAAAVQQITEAIESLPHHHHKGAKPPKSGGEPQTLSDAQLRDAIKALGVVESQIAGHPRAAKAVGHINRAVKDLEVALTIK